MDPILPLPDPAAKPEFYAALARQLHALLDGEPDFIANAANMASLVYHSLPEVNWVGFYLWKDGQLVLGPFQGKPACRRIALGYGVCGSAAAARTTLVVPDVSRFPRPHRLRQCVAVGNGGPDRRRRASDRACSTSIARWWAASIERDRGGVELLVQVLLAAC